MSEEQIHNFIHGNKWITAKDKSNPHQYCLRSENNETDFIEFVKHIRQNGYIKTYWRKEYICFDVGEYRYWTMGCPLHNCQRTGTILINRALNV